MEHCKAIIIVEKEAVASRLLQMEFSHYTNSVIITVGGMFNRAIFRFVKRFENQFPILFFCDGDVFGSKMLSLICFGSKRSRHLNLRSSDGNSMIHIAGLFPSVSKEIGLANDMEEKRPLDNKWAREMLAHLEKFGLMDERDIDVWKENLTYELEALSVAFKSSSNEPAGLGIYLTEYMRLMRLEIKPMPDDDIKSEYARQFNDVLEEMFIPEIDTSFMDDPITTFQEEIQQMIDDKSTEIGEQELPKWKDDIKDFIDDTTSETIKNHLIQQYCKDMTLKIYDIHDLIYDSIIEAQSTVEFNEELLDEIQTDIQDTLKSLLERIKPKIEELLRSADIQSDLELDRLNPDLKHCDLYDKVLSKIGVRTEDAEIVRDALRKRLI